MARGLQRMSSQAAVERYGPRGRYATSLVSDPSQIMLAYNYAANVTRNRRERLAIEAARQNFAADLQDVEEAAQAAGIAVGSLDEVGGNYGWLVALARHRAAQQRVEGLFDASIGAVATADAVDQAERALGQEATEADESYLDWAWNRMQGAGEYSERVVKELLDRSPSAVAERSLILLAQTWRETMTAAGRGTKDFLTDRSNKGYDWAGERMDVIADKLPDGNTIGVAGIVTIGVVALGAAMWFLPSFRGAGK